MGSENQTQKSARPRNRATVRFTSNEYLRITREAVTKGRSVPALLKAVYFKREPVQILMPHKSQKYWARRMGQVCNCMNKLSKRLVIADRSLFSQELRDISKQINEVVMALMDASRPARIAERLP